MYHRAEVDNGRKNMNFRALAESLLETRDRNVPR